MCFILPHNLLGFVCLHTTLDLIIMCCILICSNLVSSILICSIPIGSIFLPVLLRLMFMHPLLYSMLLAAPLGLRLIGFLR